MKDTRLTAEELDLMVSVAYGGAAYQAGRKAQARALGNLLRGKPADGAASRDTSTSCTRKV